MISPFLARLSVVHLHTKEVASLQILRTDNLNNNQYSLEPKPSSLHQDNNDPKLKVSFQQMQTQTQLIFSKTKLI